MDNDQLLNAIQQLLEGMEKRLTERIDGLEKRVVRHGGMLQGGSRIVARLSDWSEDTDVELLRHAQRIADLEKRLDKVEGGARAS